MELGKDDCLISPAQKPGFVAESDSELTVVIDTNLTPELIEEGYVREIISKVQNMRKDADFEVTDRIDVALKATEKLEDIASRFAEEIKSAVLGVSLTVGATLEDGVTQDWSINGEKASLSVRVHNA